MHTTTTGVIFIGGAGLGPWIWQDIARTISQPCAIVDFAELKKDRNLATITLDEYVGTALTQAKALQTDKIVVVAHSIGGIVGIETVKRLGTRAGGFVAACAAVPESGKSFLSIFPFPQRTITRLILKLAGTTPPVPAIKNGLCNDLDDTKASEVTAQFTPESIHLYTTKTSPTRFPAVPSLYICTSKDKEYPVALQRTMASRLPGSTVETIDAGHLPMLSQPQNFARHLQTFLERIA